MSRAALLERSPMRQTTGEVAVPLQPRSAVALAVASLLGATAFLWPLLVHADAPIAEGVAGPFLFGGVLLVVLLVVLADVVADGVDAKAVALLGVLAAIGAAVRPLGAGLAGVELIFFVLVLGGRVLGPGFGFVLGATSLFASALLTAGVGPWLPYQMVGAAWIGMGAGLLPQVRGRAELTLLAAYGAVVGFLYGVLLNLSFWPFSLGGDTSISFVAGDAVLDNLRRLFAFSLATSAGWDVGRAVTTAAMVLVTGPAMLRALRRAARRAQFASNT
jgi:energy-coupling factor transport system substrate-specific component